MREPSSRIECHERIVVERADHPVDDSGNRPLGDEALERQRHLLALHARPEPGLRGLPSRHDLRLCAFVFHGRQREGLLTRRLIGTWHGSTWPLASCPCSNITADRWHIPAVRDTRHPGSAGAFPRQDEDRQVPSYGHLTSYVLGTFDTVPYVWEHARCAESYSQLSSPAMSVCPRSSHRQRTM